jgi:hypothetical protein
MKKWVKILLWILVTVILATVCFFGYSYYNYVGKFPEDKKKYPHYIGYITQEKALLNDINKLCDKERIYFTYNGAAFRAFEVNKKYFRETILAEYQNKGYTDSGYLNFRFLVNCEGKPGWFEIIQMNLDLEVTELNSEMVNQLLKLTSKPKHWANLNYEGKPIDYYMYISYRIENGNIVEILP